MKKYVEYKEFRIPEEFVQKLESGAQSGKPVTLGEAGVFDWLNNLSSTQGWRVVWPTFQFPFVVLERDVEQN